MKIGAQPGVMTDFATEMAKRVRSAHEAGKLEESRPVAVQQKTDTATDHGRIDSVARQRLEELVAEVIESGGGEDLLYRAVQVVVTTEIAPLLQEPAVMERVCDAMASDPNVQREMDQILQELAVGLSRR